MITYGLLTEEIGKGCSSVRSLLTVHDMVAHAIKRWGSPAQRERYLPTAGPRRDPRRLRPLRARTRGATPRRRDDRRRQTATTGCSTAARSGPPSARSPTSSWCSPRRRASPTAFLVERDTPGVTVKPLAGITRHPRLDARRDLPSTTAGSPSENLIGRAGFGVSHVVAAALEHGRYSVAWGSVGIGQACLDASPRLRRRAPAGRRPDRRPPAHPPPC